MFGNLLKPQHSSFLDKSKSSMVPLLSKDENENQENKQASKFTKLSKQSFKSYVIKNKSKFITNWFRFITYNNKWWLLFYC